MEYFKIFERFGEVRCGFSLRSLDMNLESENVEENYQKWCEEFGAEVGQLALANQKHTDIVRRVENGGGLEMIWDGVDGFMTDRAGVVCTARFADCQGVFMFDPARKVVCSVHSGWRGNAQNIIGKAVRGLVLEYGCNARDLIVGVSASLGKCCAEFSEPYKELPAEMHKYIDGNFVDLGACARDQLLAEGVLVENVEFDGRCTKCDPELFYSYRRGDEGRMLGGIMIR